MLQVAGPTPPGVFAEKGLAVPSATRLQVQGPRQSLFLIFLGAPVPHIPGCSRGEGLMSPSSAVSPRLYPSLDNMHVCANAWTWTSTPVYNAS